MSARGITFLVTSLALGMAIVAHAGRPAEKAIERRVESAREVLETRMESQRPIPSFVLDRAQCLASLKVVKAGLGWGGQGSTGMVSCRLPSGEWSAPSFFSIDGVTFGLQIGVQFLESVVLFMTDFSRDILRRPRFQIGADISFAAGPYGEGQGAGALPDAHLLVYSRAKGLYAGATINGFLLAHEPRWNEAVYAGVPGPQILEIPGRQAPEVVWPFVDAVERWAP